MLSEAETVQWNPAAPCRRGVAEFERLSAAPDTLAAAVPYNQGHAVQAEYDWHLATLHAALAPAVFEVAWKVRRRLTFEQTLALGHETQAGARDGASDDRAVRFERGATLRGRAGTP